MLAERASD